jgi:hypothetical protein
MSRKSTETPDHRRNEEPANVEGQINIQPLLLWRTQPAHAFGFEDVAALRSVLRATRLLHEPRWGDAVRGDPAAAVGIAVTMFPIREVTLRTDLVMGALCLNALRGSPGAALVLGHALNFLGRDDTSLKPIGTSWFVRNLTSSRWSTKCFDGKGPSGELESYYLDKNGIKDSNSHRRRMTRPPRPTTSQRRKAHSSRSHESESTS